MYNRHMQDKYRDALLEAQRELEVIELRRACLIRLIGDLTALSDEQMLELTPPPGYVPENLTPEIKKILTLSTVHLSATQIRDALIQRGFQHSGPKNLLISVHTVLDRIKNELNVIDRDGKPAYKIVASGSPLVDLLTRLYAGAQALEKAQAKAQATSSKKLDILEETLAKGKK
jgi:hypothetical protein